MCNACAKLISSLQVVCSLADTSTLTWRRSLREGFSPLGASGLKCGYHIHTKYCLLSVIMISSLHARRYRKRFWRETNFKGIELIRKALDEAYGADQVSLVSASFRWLNHHSLMKAECNGGL